MGTTAGRGEKTKKAAHEVSGREKRFVRLGLCYRLMSPPRSGRARMHIHMLAHMHIGMGARINGASEGRREVCDGDISV